MRVHVNLELIYANLICNLLDSDKELFSNSNAVCATYLVLL